MEPSFLQTQEQKRPSVHKKQTILLIDNKEQLFAKNRIFSELLTKVKKDRGKVLASADITSALGLLKATAIDLAVIAGDAHAPFFLEEITALQRCFPGILFIFIVDNQNPPVSIDIFSATRSHLYLSASLGTEELTRIISGEIEKLTTEKYFILDMLAQEGTENRCRQAA
jgi:hypothetical protein